MAMYPNSQEIISLTELKAMINIPSAVTTYDTLLTNWIPIVRSQVETYCDRKFLKYVWQNWFEYDRALILPQWPVNNVLLLGTPCVAVTITDSSDTYQFNVSQSDSVNYTVTPKFTVTDGNTLVATDFLFSTYTNLALLKTAVEAAFPVVSFTLSTAPIPDFTKMNTQCLRRGSGYTIYGAIRQNVLYRIDDQTNRTLIIPQNVVVQFNALDYWFETSLMVIWEAGYDPDPSVNNVPQALKFIIASILQDMMSLYDLGASGVYLGIYKSEGLGDHNYSLDPSSMVSNLIRDKYAGPLEDWRKKSI